MARINPQKLITFVDDEFKTVIESFEKYLTIPCTSPAYDPDWDKNKYLVTASNLLKDYAKNSKIVGIDSKVYSDVGATPFLYTKIDGTSKDGKTILFYGHLDKQPADDDWNPGFGPYKPVILKDYIYGRGSADDGYSFYAVITMVKALKAQDILHPKIVIIIESSEESGSIDLSNYLEQYADIIGSPELIISLDSGGATYDRIWLINSLRGEVTFDLTVSTLTRGVHSGNFSGIAPDSFMILRKLISKLEKYDDKFVSLKDFEVEITDEVRKKAEETVSILGDDYLKQFPLLDGVNPLGDKMTFTTDLYLNNNWKPSLTVFGMEGVPEVKNAGNVLRPYTLARISIRLPPTFDSINKSKKIINDAFTVNTPFNATVTTSNFSIQNGIELPSLSSNLKNTLNDVSKNYLKSECSEISMSASIPFVSIISNYFPNSQLIITGAAGLDSNVHSKNEKLNIGYTKSFICTLTHLIAEYKNFI
jgi:acetylornithine deacetylase/succinyl-diaminopimelate desuccinylase-like protein